MPRHPHNFLTTHKSPIHSITRRGGCKLTDTIQISTPGNYSRILKRAINKNLSKIDKGILTIFHLLNFSSIMQSYFLVSIKLTGAYEVPHIIYTFIYTRQCSYYQHQQ